MISSRTLRLAEAANRSDGHDATADLLRDAADTIDARAAEIKRLRVALQGLDEAYCRAGTGLSKEERHEDRLRLIAARAALQGESHG